MVPRGHLISTDIKQYADLLLGSMVDQPVFLNNTLRLGSYLQQSIILTPALPPSGSLRIYPKSDNHLYQLDSLGVETDLTTGGSGTTEVWIDPEEPAPRDDLVLWVDTDQSGGGGGGGGDLNYVHTQTAPSTTWTVVHNLGKYAAVDVVDSGGSVVIPDVHYDSAAQVTLTFGSATSGKAYMN